MDFFWNLDKLRLLLDDEAEIEARFRHAWGAFISIPQIDPISVIH